jgi:hypothetical protein
MIVYTLMGRYLSCPPPPVFRPLSEVPLNTEPLLTRLAGPKGVVREPTIEGYGVDDA